MSCYQESEPAIAEEFGLDVLSAHTIEREEEVVQVIRLLKEEEIAEFGEQDVEPILLANPHQQILVLYGEFRPKLLRYLHSMYLKRDVADEVIQETFLRLTTELIQANYIENVQGWIVRVAHNLAVDVIKKREKDAARMTDFNSSELETVIDPATRPDEAVQLEEQGRRIEAALQTVTPHQRQCFNLRVQGFRYKDIGKALGISEQRAAIVVKQVAVRIAALCQ